MLKHIEYFTRIILLLVSTTCFAQNAELKSVINDLRSDIGEVQTGSDTYKQSITFVEPSIIRYEYTSTDTKGKSESHTFEFNLADLDPYTAKEETSKDMIVVNLNIRNNQKLIKSTKNGEAAPYEKEVALVARDVDNARVIKEKIVKAIPLAEKVMTNKLKLNSYDEMLSWLTQNVKNAEVDDKSFQQSFTSGKYAGSIRYQLTESDAKSSEKHLYVFNLADLNPNSLNFKISGSNFILQVGTLGKQKVISHFKNDAPEPFASEIEVTVNNVEEARDIRTVLSLIIPLAETKVKEAMPKASSQQEALTALATYITEIKYGDKVFKQNLAPTCVTTLERVEESDKTSKHVYDFNLMDLNENTLEYAITGKEMYLKVASKDKIKLIKYSKDGSFSGYENEFRLYVPDIEVGRRLKSTLAKSITFCRDNYKYAFGGSPKEKLSYVTGTVGDITEQDKTYKQNLSLVDPAVINKVKLTTVQADSKKSTEEVYEFNLTDIDPKSITYEIQGKSMSIAMETNMKNKIIKYYKDGEIKPYTSKVEIKVNDVETARNLIAALSQVIPELKK